MLLLELEDVDNTFNHAVAMGATVEMPVAEMFWGERSPVSPFTAGDAGAIRHHSE
jgi:uncharacterized glyoxalase superfamily protein PhnB